MELISICIPTYNSEKYIYECLDSVARQTYKNLEIIVSDNNSDDNTLKIVRSFKLNNLKIFKNESNVGMVENFNLSFKYSTGKYIKFLASDDKIEKKSIEKAYEVFQKNDDVVLVSSSKKVINSNSKTIFKKISSLNEGGYNGDAIINKIIYSGRNPIGEPSTALIRRSVIEEVGGFKSMYPMTLDIDFWISILNCGNFYFIDEPLASFRVHENSYSVQKNSINEYKNWLRFKRNQGYINALQYSYISFKFFFTKNIKKLIYLFNSQ